MAERLDFKGDYMGFTYNGVHSSELGIVRTSDGSRFNENLLPTMQDKTVQVPGGDGTYYFGSYYTQRQFSMSFAFDSLTEAEVARIKRHFGDKQIHDLIFDETPYKVWSAKVTGTATIKHIPFDEGSTHRLYKGEGTIQFTCYYPFARCWSTIKDDYKNHRAYQHRNAENELETDSNWEKRVNEWWAAARIESNKNFGDVPVPFTLELTTGSGACAIGDIKWTDLPVVYEEAETSKGFKEGTTYYEKDKTEYKETEDSAPSVDKKYYVIGKVILNTKTGLALGTDKNIYNKYVSGDTTAKIPVNGNVEGAQFTCLYI